MHEILLVVMQTASNPFRCLNRVNCIAPLLNKKRRPHLIRTWSLILHWSETRSFVAGMNVRVRNSWDEVISQPTILLLRPFCRWKFGARTVLRPERKAATRTHVAEALRGSGEYAVPVVLSEDGSQMRRANSAAFGDRRSISSTRPHAC